jgi:alpha-L-fucosidase
MTVDWSRRQVLKAGAVAAGSATLGAPLVLAATEAAAYTVPAKMAWWYDARFGMFIHFGSYSYAGRGEWVFANENWAKAAYHSQVTARFNPTRFSAASIVGLAKAAGMRYLVITAKHHEGFAMWDSQVAGFTDTTGRQYDLPGYTAYKSDLLAALKAECDRQGIRFGLYYSILDWSHPSQTLRKTDTVFSTMTSMSAKTSYVTQMKAHLQELLDRYDPAVMWFDGDWCVDRATPTTADWWNKADGQDLYNWLIARKPGLVVNERVKRDTGLGDFMCPEQTVPSAPLPRPWETCATLNGAWGYDAGRENSYKSPQTLIRELVTVVSRDGNYLLNIGPMGDGAVPAGSVNLLNAIGSWMTTHGSSIYGATASPFSTEPSWGRYTKKNGRLYAHVFTWPTGGTLQIPALQNTISRIHLLNDSATSLTYTVSGGYLNVRVPTTAPNTNASVVVVEVTGVPTPATGGSTGIVSGGVYKLVNQYSGKVLENGSSATQGARVVQWTDNGGTAQQWTVTAVSGGYHKLVCRRSGMALDNSSLRAPGDPVVQWTDNGGTAQQWTVTAVGAGYYKVVSRYSGLALDNSTSTADGAPSVQWTDTGVAQQRWQFVRVA